MIYGRPVSSHFPIQVLVPDRAASQLSSDCFGAAVLYEMLHGLVDEAAALPGLSHTVNSSYGRFRKNDVDPFAHGIEERIISAWYTQPVCMSSFGVAFSA